VDVHFFVYGETGEWCVVFAYSFSGFWMPVACTLERPLPSYAVFCCG